MSDIAPSRSFLYGILWCLLAYAATGAPIAGTHSHHDPILYAWALMAAGYNFGLSTRRDAKESRNG